MIFRLALFLTSFLVFPAYAGTESDEDRLIVNRISETEFEVVETQDMSARAFWCGAASYIERRQGLSSNTRIILKSPRGSSVTRAGAKGVVFTISAGNTDVITNPQSVNVRRVGLSLLSYQARGFCRDAFTRATK